jgi:hypothetical protein
MTEYEVNFHQLDYAINNLEPFFRVEFCRQIGDETKKVINKEQHSTAHVVLKDASGCKGARVTTAISYDFAAYNTINNEAVYDYFLKLYISDEKYKILSSVDYLFTYYNTQKELDKNQTIVMMVDSLKLVNYINTFAKGGNKALTLAGLPVISGYISIPLSLLQEIGCLIEYYTIDWNTYSYSNMHGITKPLLGKTIKRSWGFYGLAMTSPKKKVVAICLETKEYETFESLTDATIALFTGSLNNTDISKKKLKTTLTCVSACINGKQKKVAGINGHWYTLFTYTEAKQLEAEGKLKEAIADRFKKQIRSKRV